METVIHYSWTSKEQNKEEWSHTFCGLKNADRLNLTDKVKNTTCKSCLKSLKK